MDYAFNDLGGLQSINKLAKKDRGAAISQVAQQFESFFVSQMLKGMRAANDLLAADDPFQTQEMQFRQQMLDDQLGVSLSQGRGLGLAEVFERGLRRQKLMLKANLVLDRGNQCVMLLRRPLRGKA